MASPSPKIDALTGMRFFAAFAIMLAHTDNAFSDGSILRAFPLHQAVSFFFVLSGFILSYRYADFDNQKFPLRRYFANRGLKIWPVHMLCIAILLLCIPGQLQKLINDPAYLRAGLLNIGLLQSWLGSEYFYASLNGVAWSISCEAFFYVAFPYLRQRVSWRVLLGVFLVTMILVMSCTYADSLGMERRSLIYTHPLFRLFEFCLGIFAFRVYRSLSGKLAKWGDSQAICALLLLLGNLLACQVVFDATPPDSQFIDLVYWVYCAGACAAGAACIVIFAANSGRLSSFFATKHLVLLGNASYALYMVHAIVIGVLAKGIAYWYQYNIVLVFAGVFLISIAASILIYICFEKPLKQVVERRAVTARTLMHSMAVVAFVAALAFISFPAHRYLSVDDFDRKLSEFDRSGHFSFAKGFQIEGFRVICRKQHGIARIEFAAQSRLPLTPGSALGVHLVDKTGAILVQGEGPLAATQNIDSGQRWIEPVMFPPNNLPQIAGIRVAVFQRDDQSLESVTGTTMDWNGKAGYIRLPQACQ